MRLRAGLLLDRDGKVFTFPHRTFQEYLAGTHLALMPDFPLKASELVEQGDFWRVVILLAVGHLAHNNRNRAMPLMLVNELCPEQSEDNNYPWQRTVIAGEALLELGVNRAQDTQTGKSTLKRVRARLTQMIEQSQVTARQRAEAGDVLAKLGDPRFDADHWHLPDDPTLGFVEIPAGPFLMGSDPKKDSSADKDEFPQHEVTLPDYYLARYPVTVAQFRAFVEASGYNKFDKDALADLDNRPVRYVTWYDALAYTKWLQEELQMVSNQKLLKINLSLKEKDFWQGLNKGKLQITLPTEPEWEKAARGEDGRIYPWGDEPDPERANYGDTGIGTTSAVGCFPDGASPYGVLDISGNVWEWTRSLWGTDWENLEYEYPYNTDDGRENLDAGRDVLRVLRGGAFLRPTWFVRCAFRHWVSPLSRDLSVGFRVVASLRNEQSE